MKNIKKIKMKNVFALFLIIIIMSLFSVFLLFPIGVKASDPNPDRPPGVLGKEPKLLNSGVLETSCG